MAIAAETLPHWRPSSAIGARVGAPKILTHALPAALRGIMVGELRCGVEG